MPGAGHPSSYVRRSQVSRTLAEAHCLPRIPQVAHYERLTAFNPKPTAKRT